MSGRTMMASRTYLEMRASGQLVPAAQPHGRVEVAREDCSPAEWRDLYAAVGRPYHWVDRLPWSDHDIAAYLADPLVSLWIMRVNGERAGYFELRRHDADGSVEIAYFGLLPSFIGRGLGGHLLTVAARRAWDLVPTRVWLHTSTLDHPAALPNYLKRGFVVARRETYIVPV